MAEPWLTVRTYDLKSGKMLETKDMQLTPVNANWLVKHVAWAANYGKGVQVFNRLDQGKADAL